jgi:hypothetical protein
MEAGVIPASGVSRNPLLGIRDMEPVPIGVRLSSLAPDVKGLLVCRYNGEWLLREHWEETTTFGDVVEWHEYPQGRESVRILLQVALVLSTIVPGGQVLTPYLIAANLAYNLLVPPRQPNINNATPGSIYSAGLAGNVARLDQPIWKNCGHVKITPPFAAIPYTINLPRDGADDPLVDTEQYGYFLYCVGIGDHEVVREFIGKTPLSSFQDVLTARYLAPGEAPQDVLANVLTSSEVVELELATDENGDGVYVGGYVACRPRDRVTKIGIDVNAPQGLGHVTSGGSEDLVVAWQVEVREIDDFGIPLSEWTVVGSESREMDTNSAQRWSNEYELSAPIRCEVRLYRTNEKNRDSDARDQINWSALRAYLEADAPLNPNAAHYELVIRASKQLSAESQRDFGLIVNGMCPTWHPDTGWTANVVTRNAAWWLADLWRDEDWGEGLDDSRIDLQGLYDWSLTLDDRQDHFDFTFATSMDASEAAQLIARTGRARASSPIGIRAIARDELVTLPFTAFSSRNTQPDSITQSVDLAKRETPDAIIVTYQDHVRGDLQEIECVVPGIDSESLNPLFVHLDGIRGAKHAEREGLYMAAKVAYRGTSFSLTTEMEGVLLRHLDTVKVQPDLPEYGQTGDVTYYDEATLALELSEPADFSVTPLYIVLRRDDGTLTEPVEVTPGVNPTTVYLPEAPDFQIVFDAGDRERPIYFLGPESSDELCKVEEISDGGQEDGAHLFDVKLVLDDPRVHSADVHLLPGPGEIQDPIDDGSYIPSESGSTATLVRLSNHTIYNTGFEIADFPDGTGGIAIYRLFEDGRSGYAYSTNITPGVGTPVEEYIDGEWINTAPVEVSEAALYEVYVEDFGTQQQLIDLGSVAALNGTFNTWLPLGVDYEFELTDLTGPSPSFSVAAVLRVSIRLIGSTVVQARRTINLVLSYADETP